MKAQTCLPAGRLHGERKKYMPARLSHSGGDKGINGLSFHQNTQKVFLLLIRMNHTIQNQVVNELG